MKVRVIYDGERWTDKTVSILQLIAKSVSANWQFDSYIGTIDIGRIPSVIGRIRVEKDSPGRIPGESVRGRAINDNGSCQNIASYETDVAFRVWVVVGVE